MTSSLWRAQLGGIWPRLNGRVLRLGAAYGLGAAVIFGGNGLWPKGFVHIMATSVWARLGLWLLWVIPWGHATRVIWDAPETLLMRTWPLPRGRLLVVPLALLAYVELPWVVLLAAGGGPILGLTALLGAGGLHALAFGGIRNVGDAAAVALLATAVALPPAHPLSPLAAGPGAVIAVLAAWDRGGERRHPRTWRWVRGLMSTNLAAVVRQESALVVRGILLCGMGAGMALLGARNNDVVSVESLRRLSLAVGSVMLGAALAGIAAATQRMDARDGWLLGLAGASRRRRRRSAAVATALFGLAGGVVHGLVAGMARPSVAIASAMLGVIIGALVTGVVWRADSFAKMMLGLLAAILLATVACACYGEFALAPLALLAALLIA